MAGISALLEDPNINGPDGFNKINAAIAQGARLGGNTTGLSQNVEEMAAEGYRPVDIVRISARYVPAWESANMFLPHPTMVNTGNQLIPYNVAGAGMPNAGQYTQAGGGIPLGMTPAELNELVPIHDPTGQGPDQYVPRWRALGLPQPGVGTPMPGSTAQGAGAPAAGPQFTGGEKPISSNAEVRGMRLHSCDAKSAGCAKECGPNLVHRVVRAPAKRCDSNAQIQILLRCSAPVLSDDRQANRAGRLCVSELRQKNGNVVIRTTLSARMKHVLAGTSQEGKHCPHGWRHTFSTLMNDRHEEKDRVIDRMLVHSRSGSEARYNNVQYLKQAQALACEWADDLLQGAPDAFALANVPRPAKTAANVNVLSRTKAAA